MIASVPRSACLNLKTKGITIYRLPIATCLTRPPYLFISSALIFISFPLSVGLCVRVLPCFNLCLILFPQSLWHSSNALSLSLFLYLFMWVCEGGGGGGAAPAAGYIVYSFCICVHQGKSQRHCLLPSSESKQANKLKQRQTKRWFCFVSFFSRRVKQHFYDQGITEDVFVTLWTESFLSCAARSPLFFFALCTVLCDGFFCSQDGAFLEIWQNNRTLPDRGVNMDWYFGPKSPG